MGHLSINVYCSLSNSFSADVISIINSFGFFADMYCSIIFCNCNKDSTLGAMFIISFYY